MWNNFLKLTLWIELFLTEFYKQESMLIQYNPQD